LARSVAALRERLAIRRFSIMFAAGEPIGTGMFLLSHNKTWQTSTRWRG
jgi:hypothetical protein